MTGKIFRSTLAASLTVLLASLLVITGCLYTYFATVREQQLQTELTLAAAAVEADGADYLARVRDTAERLTWVASDGTVLYDTRTDTQPMENHGQREEIREALTGGSGSSARYSETLTEKMLYQAVRLTDGSVLRISGSQKTVWMLVLGMLHAVIVDEMSMVDVLLMHSLLEALPQEACLGTTPLALGLSHCCAFGSDSGLGEPFLILEPLLVLFHLFLWLPRILWLAHWPPLLCVWTSSSPCDLVLRA